MSWPIRMLIGLAIVALAVVFPWWIWMPALVVVTLFLHPYWEGPVLMIIFDLLYGGSLPDAALFTLGSFRVHSWMIYLALFLLLLVVLPNQRSRQVY